MKRQDTTHVVVPQPHNAGAWRLAVEFIGIAVHKRESQVCILAAGGEVVLEQRIRTERERFAELLGRRPKARILMEASTESEWVARCLEQLGHEVVVADPNFSPMYATRSRKVKTDKRAPYRWRPHPSNPPLRRRAKPRHLEARTEGRRNLEEPPSSSAVSQRSRGYTPAPRPSTADAARGAAASAEARATCCRKTTRTNNRRCLTRGAASRRPLLRPLLAGRCLTPRARLLRLGEPGHPIGERPTVRLAEHIRAAQALSQRWPR